MKPSFALDFRDGSIALLHRTSRGWQQVGAAALDAPDLAEALSYMRSTALGLSPRGLSTKLVIPNDLILYTTVHAPGPEVAKRRRQIKAALEGLTPYKPDDLVFDWWGSGTEVQVAVVARETLAEAEAFATEHRLNPVSFVGAPENASYMGEPFFGPSALSASLLGEGEKVERDQDPVSVVAREAGKTPVPDAVAVEKPTVVTKTDADKTPAQKPVSQTPQPVAPDVTVTPTDVRQRAPEPKPPAPAPQPVAAEPSAPAPEVTTAPAASPARMPPPDQAPAAKAAVQRDALPDFAATKGQPASNFDPAVLAIDLVDEAPMAVDVADEPAPPPTAFPAEPPVTLRPAETAAKPPEAVVQSEATAKVLDDVPPSPSSAIIASFASRRAGPTPAEAEKLRKIPSLGPAPQQRPTVARPAMAKPAVVTAPSAPSPFPAKATASATRFPPGKAVKPISSAPAGLQIKRDRNVVQLPKQVGVPGEDATADTVANPVSKGVTGLDGRPVTPRGKPRYLGLILTGLLILALALVAAWSKYYLTLNDPDPNAAPAAVAAAAPATATAPAVGGTDLAAADQAVADTAMATADNIAAPADALTSSTDALPTAEDEALADGQVPLDAGANPADTAAVSETPADAVATDPSAIAAVTVPAPEVAKPEPAPGTLVTTEAAQVGAQGSDPQDEIFLADADTAPQTWDPLTLPQLVASNDSPPDIATPPPPFGTLYSFDAEGRIMPTPEGIVTPEGVLLIAGTPKVVPPTRPAQTAAADPVLAPTAPLPASTGPAQTEPAQTEPAQPAPGPADLGSTAAVTALQDAATAASEALASDPGPFPSDPALADKRPKSRPAGLVDPAAATAKQGEVPSTALSSRFASVRPQARPAAMTTPPTQTVEAAPDAELANTAAAASLALNGVQPSALAVSVSKKPASRPSGMDQAVNAAVAAAVRAPEPEPQQQVASAAPEAQSEPEVQNQALSLPTNASVARQATTKDALNLSRVSLLGVFGTASGRYAMIRQPNGGVKKVVVGDRLDGGQVAAITDNAVQYQKGGRMVTLSLPTG